MSTRRDQILDVAEQVLEDVGADRFGINELARALGIKPPSLYKHFAGREAIVHALISRGMRRLGAALDETAGLADFCVVYRAQALAAPQLYRLMNDRPLQRELLDPGAEVAGMHGVLDLFGEAIAHHPIARAAWASAHGLVSLEIADRFPPGTAVEESWDVLIRALSPLARP